MTKKLIRWDMVSALYGFCAECPWALECPPNDPDDCPIWASLEDAPITRAEIEEAIDEELNDAKCPHDFIGRGSYFECVHCYKRIKEPENE